MIKAISFIFKKSSLTQDQFKEHYENSHAPLARSILEFSHYERNHILNFSAGNPSCISIFKYSSEELLKKTQKILEDYLVAACNDAMNKLEKETKDKMGSVMNLPGGMKLPF